MLYKIIFEGEERFLVLDNEGKVLNDFPCSPSSLSDPRQLKKGQIIDFTNDTKLVIKAVASIDDFTKIPINKAYYEIRLAILGSKDPVIMIELNLIAERARENRNELISYLELQLKS